MNSRYIGITGFTEFEEVERMLKVFETRDTWLRFKLGVGVKINDRSFNDTRTRYMDMFPQKEIFSDIFASGKTFNCLHYSRDPKKPTIISLKT